MEKRMKSENNPKMNANKIRTSITLNPETLARSKEIGLNLSSFTERALIWLFSQIESGNVQLLNENTLILSPDLQNKLKTSAAHRIRTGDLGIMSPAPNLTSFSENSPNSGDLEFSQGSRFDGLRASAEIADGDMLPPNDGYSMADFMRSRESDYRLWKKKEGVSEDTVDKYVSSMKSLTWLYTYDDLKKYEDITKSERDAIGQVSAYIQKWADAGETFNGDALRKYTDRSRDDYKKKIGSRSSQKTKDLISRPDVLEIVIDTLPDDVAMFYVMSCFGARTSQLYHLYDKPLSITMSDDKSYFWINAEELSKGHKKAFYYFFPSWMLPVVKNWRRVRSTDIKHPEKQYNDIVSDVSRVADPTVPANLSSLRKFAKAVTTESGIPNNVAEFTQGRTPPGIGARAYDNLEFAAKRDFGKTLPFWKERVIFPSWMSDEAEIKKRLAAVEKEFKKSKAIHSRWEKGKPKNSGRQQLSDEKRENIISRLKRGESRRKIADAVKVARATVDKVAADLKA